MSKLQNCIFKGCSDKKMRQSVYESNNNSNLEVFYLKFKTK